MHHTIPFLLYFFFVFSFIKFINIHTDRRTYTLQNKNMTPQERYQCIISKMTSFIILHIRKVKYWYNTWHVPWPLRAQTLRNRNRSPVAWLLCYECHCRHRSVEGICSRKIGYNHIWIYSTVFECLMDYYI